MKKRDNIILASIFLFLLVFYILQKTVLKPDPRSFKEELTAFDPTLIDRIEYNRQGEVITLEKTDQGWQVSNDDQSVKAREGSVDGLLEAFANIKTSQLVSKSPDKWVEYEVDENKASIYSLYEGDQMLSKIYFGRFNFDQQAQSSTSYVRLDGEDDIYSVDGFLSMTAKRDFNAFRKNKLLDVTPAEISSLKMTSGDLVESFDQSIDGKWLVGNTMIDSSQMARYLQKLSGITGRNFEDDFVPGTGFGVVQSIQINDSIQVDAYLKDKSFVLKSSQNDAYFSSDSSGIYKNIFTDLENLASGE